MTFTRFFSQVQETKWYRAFLSPVVDEVSPPATLLDIGTGTGKLLQILSKKKGITCTGVDTHPGMLAEARKKINDKAVPLQETAAHAPLPFAPASFDYITICNVLFLLDRESQDNMLDEVFRVLKPEGQLIVLSPSGQGSLFKLIQLPRGLIHPSIFLWFFLTRRRASEWRHSASLTHYAEKNQLIYSGRMEMHKLAWVEGLKKKNLV